MRKMSIHIHVTAVIIIGINSWEMCPYIRGHKKWLSHRGIV